MFWVRKFVEIWADSESKFLTSNYLQQSHWHNSVVLAFLKSLTSSLRVLFGQSVVYALLEKNVSIEGGVGVKKGLTWHVFRRRHLIPILCRIVLILKIIMNSSTLVLDLLKIRNNVVKPTLKIALYFALLNISEHLNNNFWPRLDIWWSNCKE